MNLGEMKKIWHEKGFRPLKRMGQNFLYDENIKKKILGYLPDEIADVIIEVGPGFGAMSFQLKEHCKKLVLVEKDRKICEIMEPLFSRVNGIILIRADIMEVDLREYAGTEKKLTIYGNIPYNISTPLLEKIINCRESIDKVYFVMQEEVVDRIVAEPGTKEYGSLSCFVQYNSKAKKLMAIKKNCFYPVPKVESALLSLDFSCGPSVNVSNEDLFFSIIRKAFSQRRKKAINPLVTSSLKGLTKDEWLSFFASSGIDNMSRAEDISLLKYAELTNAADQYIQKNKTV